MSGPPDPSRYPDFSRYQALVFDCDGTLATTAHVHHAVLAEAIRSLGHDLPAAFYLARTGMSLEHLLDEFAGLCGRRIGSAEVLPIATAAYRRDIANISEIVEVTSIVRRFAGEKPLAVASSGGRALVDATLGHLGIADCFDAVVSVEDVRAPKPAPDAYLLAAARLKVDPKACLAFEDSDQGVRAARAAGMDVIDVSSPGWAG